MITPMEIVLRESLYYDPTTEVRKVICGLRILTGLLMALKTQVQSKSSHLGISGISAAENCVINDPKNDLG